MGELLRTVSGDFCIENSLKLDDIKELVSKDEIEGYIIPPDRIFKEYPQIHASYEALKYIKNGNKVERNLVHYNEWEERSKYRLYTDKGQFIGLYTLENTGFLKPEVILIDLDKV